MHARGSAARAWEKEEKRYYALGIRAQREFTYLGFGGSGGGIGRRTGRRLCGDLEKRRAVAALDVLAARRIGHNKNAAAFEIRTHNANGFGRCTHGSYLRDGLSMDDLALLTKLSSGYRVGFRWDRKNGKKNRNTRMPRFSDPNSMRKRVHSGNTG